MPPDNEFVLSNLRLAELVAIVNENKAFFEDFVKYLREAGYVSIRSFVTEKSDKKAASVILGFLQRTSKVNLLDGLGRPYDNAQARWYFLGWLLRDAPAQRLRPLVDAVPGASTQVRQAYLLNEVRKFVAPLFRRTTTGIGRLSQR